MIPVDGNAEAASDGVADGEGSQVEVEVAVVEGVDLKTEDAIDDFSKTLSLHCNDNYVDGKESIQALVDYLECKKRFWLQNTKSFKFKKLVLILVIKFLLIKFF